VLLKIQVFWDVTSRKQVTNVLRDLSVFTFRVKQSNTRPESTIKHFMFSVVIA
jgi:hypothetical protein